MQLYIDGVNADEIVSCNLSELFLKTIFSKKNSFLDQKGKPEDTAKKRAIKHNKEGFKCQATNLIYFSYFRLTTA